jgi:hypothetical protein
MTYTFLTIQPILLVILSAGLVADRLPSVSSPQTKFGGHKFKRDCDMKTAVTRCLITEDVDCSQQGTEKLVPRYGRCLSFDCVCVAK